MRDGAYGQINAAHGLHDWNVRHNHNMFMIKTSGGCSMSESPNDLGYMHSILHNLFKGKDFKCKVYDDPPDPSYAALKKYLKKYIVAASFDTFWRCIVAMRPFMGKAFTTMNILSALKLAGFEGGRIVIETVMAHNVEFGKLGGSQSDKVLGLIRTVFCRYWWRHALIHEKIFDEVFDGEEDIDTLEDRVGKKPLNELATNRQRFMMDNSDAWFAELDRRKEEKRIAEELRLEKIADRETRQADPKQTKLRFCSQPSCQNSINVTTAKLRKLNEVNWTHCTGTRCAIWGCPDHGTMITDHMKFCRKIQNRDLDFIFTE